VEMETIGMIDDKGESVAKMKTIGMIDGESVAKMKTIGMRDGESVAKMETIGMIDHRGESVLEHSP
jgi:hypothetical protein